MSELTDFVVLCHGVDSPLPSDETPMNKVSIALRQQITFRRAHVLVSLANTCKTYDGIDVCAERLLVELEDTLSQLRDTNRLAPEKTLRLSVVGHSLGGMILRYAVKLLYDRGWLVGSPASRDSQNKSVFRGIFVPVSYVSLASPHVGIIRAATWAGWVQAVAGEMLFSGTRTLDQLMVRDEPEYLLVQMSQGAFLQALALFKHRTAVSCVNFDHQVTHVSSSITRKNQYQTQGAFYRYLMSFCSSRYVDRVAGYSDFDDEYDTVLGYHPTSAKKHDADVAMDGTKFVTYSWHAQRYTVHPHSEKEMEGDDEIDSEDPRVQTCLKNLQQLKWRRLDFEILSFFSHDSVIGQKTLQLPFAKVPYGWKSVVKIAKVLALDHALFQEEEDTGAKEAIKRADGTTPEIKN